ncbi:energy transducer TonB [Sphingomonas sp. BN140010]|uniref:Energy transducer TonB n=1 Tax=Sphingomonas arvum TaxID=2992113 RepID=A0ABT3JHY2_9SPHN|nr:energy transducer TonB [Sphingomonas sp. BN140010]MCW3798559.1 energy transducer TonB [Sphingomonas sp. BN140010]
MIVSLALIAAAVPTVPPPVISVPPPVTVTPAPLPSPMPAPALFQRAVPPTPIGPLPALLSPNDYPAEALRLGQQGTVGAALTISDQGRVTACAIERSSGSVALDVATCRLLRARARFAPAKDAMGASVDGATRTTIRWVLPPQPRVPLKSWASTVTFTLIDGQVRRCTEERTRNAPTFINNCQSRGTLQVIDQVAPKDARGREVRFVSFARLTPFGGGREGTAPVGEPVINVAAKLAIDAQGKVTGCSLQTDDVRGLPQPQRRPTCQQLFSAPYAVEASGAAGTPTSAVAEMMLVRLP